MKEKTAKKILELDKKGFKIPLEFKRKAKEKIKEALKSESPNEINLAKLSKPNLSQLV